MVEPRSELDQGGNRAMNLNASRTWDIDSRDEFQQCALARAIAANDPDHLAGMDLERDILEGLEIMKRALVTVNLRKDFPQRVRTLVDHAKALRHIFDRNDRSQFHFI